jgi:Kef-type K+ transport system membrane component KefB
VLLGVDTVSFLAIVSVAVLAAAVSGWLAPRFVLPVVVLEILFGIVIGPEVLGLAGPDEFIDYFSTLGLGMLFFFAGYEIDFRRIAGSPLRLAALGWLLSLLLSYALGGLLALGGVVLSLLFVGTAMATTAIGTLIPILGDAGETKTRFGTYLLAAGAAGEFGPILLITLLFGTKNPLGSFALMLAFVLLAVLAALIAVRSIGRGWNLFEKTMESSGQLAVRATVVIIFALAAVAAKLGLDLLLGGFVAGVIVSLALRGREVEQIESKLTAVGYGFLIPFFFVVTGVEYDIRALLDDPKKFLEVGMFVVLFLIVRGAPAMLLYRRFLDLRDRIALGVFSATELPLVVAITTIAVSEGHMTSGTAASLVGAAIVSTAVMPTLGLQLRGDRVRQEQLDLHPAPAWALRR